MEVQSNPCASGEGAAEDERVGVNEADERGMVSEEGRGVDVGKFLTGASGEGACGSGGGEGVADPGRVFLNAIV